MWLIWCLCSVPFHRFAQSFHSLWNWAAARQNQQNDLCAQRRLRSAQSDQSLCCALNGQGFFIRAVKALIRLNRCPGWSVFAGRTGHFVGFVVLQLNFKDFNEGCLILMALMWRITGIWSFVLVKIMARKMARTLYFAYKSLCELQAIYELLAIIQALCSASLTFWMPVL